MNQFEKLFYSFILFSFTTKIFLLGSGEGLDSVRTKPSPNSAKLRPVFASSLPVPGLPEPPLLAHDPARVPASTTAPGVSKILPVFPSRKPVPSLPAPTKPGDKIVPTLGVKLAPNLNKQSAPFKQSELPTPSRLLPNLPRPPALSKAGPTLGRSPAPSKLIPTLSVSQKPASVFGPQAVPSSSPVPKFIQVASPAAPAFGKRPYLADSPQVNNIECHIAFLLGSIPDPGYFGMDPDPRIRTPGLIWIMLFFSATKIFFFAYNFLKVHLHHSSKIKSHKEFKKQ